MGADHCMPVGLTYDAGLKNCATAYHLLFTLAAFNIWSAFLSLIFGHESVRRKMPSFTKSDKWRPWTAIVMSLIHPFAMLAATLAIRVNGFYPNIFLVFAVWTMRPRMVAGPMLYCLAACFSKKAREGNNPYLWTFKDNVIEESLLNIFSLPFALFFIIARNDSEQGWCATDSSYRHFWDSFYLIAGAGVLSLILLVMLLAMVGLRYRRRDVKQYTAVANPQTPMVGFNQFPMQIWGVNKFSKQVTVQVVGVDGYPKQGAGIDKFWGWTLWIGAVNMLLAFSGQWLLWGTFIHSAGMDFCPGSLTGESLAWAVALFLIAIGRPIVGGPSC